MYMHIHTHYIHYEQQNHVQWSTYCLSYLVPYKWFFSRELYFTKVAQILICGSYFRENDRTTEPHGLTTRFEILIFANDRGIREIRENCTPQKKNTYMVYTVKHKIFEGCKFRGFHCFPSKAWKLFPRKWMDSYSHMAKLCLRSVKFIFREIKILTNLWNL